MKKLFVFLEEVWKFFKLLIKEWVYFPVGCYKKIIHFLDEKNEIYNIFNKMNPIAHKATVTIGLFLIVLSIIGFDKKIFLLEKETKLFLLSESFFLGLFLIIINLNLKKKINIILISLIFMFFVLFDYRVKTFLFLFLILLVICFIIFQVKEIFVICMTFMFHILFSYSICSLIIYLNQDYFGGNLPNECVYGIFYIFITISLVLYLLVGFFINKIAIRGVFDKSSAEKFSYKMFANVLTSMYIILFFILNAKGYLYIEGVIGNYYNVINNSFLTLVTISQLSKMDIFLYNIRNNFENIKKIIVKIRKKELNK
ncbi:hypothetical protein C4097_09460 [Clostridioides difficile]|nr:hypothetical protein [Clostridioides difficile]